MRRPETALLHGPWDTTPDDDALTDLRAEFGARWKIWRAMSAQRILGDWCAHRIHGMDALRGLSEPTAAELRAAIEEAER
jgi:hypothetical protein